MAPGRQIATDWYGALYISLVSEYENHLLEAISYKISIQDSYVKYTNGLCEITIKRETCTITDI